MNRGHEDCWRSNYTPTRFAMGGIMPHTMRCDRAHMEEVRADDGLGTGPVVADHCQCCGEIIRRRDYA